MINPPNAGASATSPPHAILVVAIALLVAMAFVACLLNRRGGIAAANRPGRVREGSTVLRSCVPNDRSVVARRTPLWESGASVTGIDGLLTEREAQYLIDAADRSGTCRRSKVISNDNKNVDSEARTSTTCFLEKGGDEVLRCIEQKIADAADRPRSHLEPLQVTRYTQGQQYKPHFDFFTNGHKKGDRQRTTTLFAYIKGIEEGCGGATVFSELKRGGESLRVHPKTGSAVVWENLNADGSGNPNTRHGGEPVTCAHAEKIGLNAWFGDRAWS